MNTLNQKLHDEIEVERLWIMTQQGEYVVFTMTPISILLVFGLWNSSAHTLLVTWFSMLLATNFLRWKLLRHYRIHKQSLKSETKKFKRMMLLISSLIGFCWVIGIHWFLVPSEPANVLIMSISLFVQVVGAMLTWFCYLLAVVVIALPSVFLFIFQLFVQADRINVVTAFIFSFITISIITTTVKLAKMLNHTLQLNFENAALRRDFEEKSILLETVLENMDQGISMSDKDDRLRMWNNKFVNLLGEAGSLVAFNADLTAILDTTNPFGHPYSQFADNVWREKSGENNSAVPRESKIWSKYWLGKGQIYEIRQSDLTQGGRILTYTDITDQVKHVEALEKAKKEAEQANAAKTRFLAAASHDLRQPIHALGLFFAELSDRVHSPETALVIGQINDSIAAINSMLNALLDISKLDAGVVKPNLENCNLKDIFNRLKTDFQPIALENHNELRIRPSSATVTTDPVMLERMLRNLIGNALRYTENGKVLIVARQRKQHIDIQIIDNGAGIPKDQLDDIFIEFHQLQNPARDRRRGLGLGLAIVKRLAALLDHNIKVVSQFGRGSCFSINLPLAHKQTTTQPIQQVDTAYVHNYSLEGRQILVLDDDISVLEGMRSLLSHWGCQVISAGSPSEAVDKVAASKHKPEVLIIDYRLTDNVSGIDVAINLQKRFGYSIAVLIITGDTGPERLQEADTSGFPLLHKPVQPAKLRSTLHYLISKGIPKPD